MGMSAHHKALTKFRHDGSLDHLYELIVLARAAALASDHSEYKVGVSLFSSGGINGDGTYAFNANKIPDKIREAKIGTAGTNGSNPTSHGELMLLKDADPARKNYLGCNFPNCPNCVKKAIVHGVYALVIDAQIDGDTITPRAFSKKNFEDRFRDGWENLSLPIIRAAGMHVIGVDPESRKIGIIHHGLSRNDRPALSRLDFFMEPFVTIAKEPNPIAMRKSGGILQPELRRIFSNEAQAEIRNLDIPAIARKIGESGERVAVARMTDAKGRKFIMAASESLPPGMKENEFIAIEQKFAHSRYTASICPLVRLMMEAPRRGFSLQDEMVACNYMPQTGRHVDLVACGVERLFLPEGLLKQARHDPDYHLIEVLDNLKALKYKPLPARRLPPSSSPGQEHCPHC